MKKLSLQAILAAAKSRASSRRRRTIRFTGRYSSWGAALKASDGYDAKVILERTRAALLKVKRGEARFERDSVLLDAPEYSFPLLAGLLRAALGADQKLCVLDFGGSLGSTYFQCRSFLAPLKEVRWLVVEQPAHVEVGQRDFQSDELRFFPTAEECVRQHRVNVLLLSGVLQYLPEPYGVLATLLRLGIRHLILDRVTFLESGGERLTVQHVPDSIYPASYPAWFLSESKLTATVREAGYEMVADFPSLGRLGPEDEKACCKGFIFEKK